MQGVELVVVLEGVRERRDFGELFVGFAGLECWRGRGGGALSLDWEGWAARGRVDQRCWGLEG